MCMYSVDSLDILSHVIFNNSEDDMEHLPLYYSQIEARYIL